MINAESLAKTKKLLTIFNPAYAWSINDHDPRSEPRYFVEKKPIHEGNMGSIYKAWDGKIGQFVAVKVLYDFVQQDEHYASMIKNEAHTMANINHPGIPIIYDFTLTHTPEGDGLAPVMIMEYIERESLQQRLKSKIPLPPEETIRIISQIASVIDYIAEKHQLYHGDIKPSQILLCEPHVKIVDFGTSTAVNLAGKEYTPEFAAPERQFNGTRNLATEEFSLAATAYNIITGRVIGLDIKDLSKPIVKFKKLSKWNFRYDLDDDNIAQLNEIFEKALATNSKDRYQSASEFSEKFAIIMASARIRKRSFFKV